MTSRRRCRRAAAAGAVLLLTVAAPAAAEPSPSPSSSSSSAPLLPVTVTLDALRPVAPQPGDVLRLRGTLTNVSTEAISGLTVRLLVSPSKVGSRGEFDQYADTPDGPPPLDAAAPSTAAVSLPSSDLTPGASEPYRVSVPVDDLQLSAPWQVYEIAVVVDGLVPAGQQQLGRLRTFLPWAPIDTPGAGLPTRLAWIWPLVDRPHRTTDTTWTDDLLAPELSDGGRLRELVTVAGAAAAQHRPPPRPPRRHGKHRAAPAPPNHPLNPVPVTWVVDPLLIDDAVRMAGGYSVGSGDGRHPGSGQDAARTWLAAVRSAVASGELLGLPYADPDVIAATRTGLSTKVQVARTVGRELLASPRGLDRTSLSYAWPPDGLLDSRTLDTLFAAGVTTFVLDSTALPVEGGVPNETPSAHATFPSRDAPSVDALLIDHALADVVNAGAVDPAGGRLAVQRVLSELLMIQAELPSDQRSIVIAPRRRWDPPSGYAGELLSDSGRVPWVEPVRLSQVAASPVYDKVTRGALTYPSSERGQQLGRNYLDNVADMQQRIDALALILPDGDPQARAFDAGVLRLLSSGWRRASALARSDLAALDRTVTATMNKVRISSGSTDPNARRLVTLTSHSGTVPVTVTNDLDSPVTVVVGISETPHLDVKEPRVTTTIPPHRQFPVDIHATAQTSGVFPLTVSLYTPGANGRRYGEPVALLVRSTAYGTNALIITGGATALLLCAVAVRLFRRARAARRAAADGP